MCHAQWLDRAQWNNRRGFFLDSRRLRVGPLPWGGRANGQAPPRPRLAPARQADARARCPPATVPGAFGARCVVLQSTAVCPLPPCVWQVTLRRDSPFFSFSRSAPPAPAQIRARSLSHRPPTDLPGCGPLKAASEVAPAPSRPCRPHSRGFVRLCTQGLFLPKTRMQGGPGAPPSPSFGPPHHPAPASPAPHPLPWRGERTGSIGATRRPLLA